MSGRGSTPEQAEAERRWSATRETLRRLRGGSGATRAWLYWGYVAALVSFPAWLAAADALVDPQPLAADAAAGLLERLSLAGPAALLALLALGLRFAAWHGLVVVSGADIHWLLAAPVPRARVLGPRLSVLLGGATLAGGLLGAVAGAALAMTLGLPAASVGVVAASGAIGGMPLGALAAAAGWLVQCRASWARRVLRAAPAVVVGGTGVALAGWLSLLPAPAGAAWSGPWGWAFTPLLAAAGRGAGVGGAGAAVVAVLGLVACAGVGVAAAVRELARAPIGELRRREATATSVLASAVYAADLRSGSRARRHAITSLAGRRAVTRRAPRRQALAIAWGSGLLLIRARERIGHAVLWVAVAGAAAAALWPSDWRVATLPVAAAVAYLAASAVVEPLRAELEERFTSRAGAWPLRHILLRQAGAPAAALAALAVAAVAAAAAVGAVPAGAAVWLAGAGVAASVLLVGCAAVVAAGPGPDPVWLYSGDLGTTMLLAHLAQGAHLAAAVVGLPGAVALGALDAGAPAVLVAGAGFGWTALAGAGLARWASRRLGAFH